MTQRQISLSLRYAATAIFVAAAVIAALGLFLPLRTQSSATSASPTLAAGSRGGTPTTLPELGSFEPLFNRPLRVALGDTPPSSQPAPDAAPQAAVAPPSLVLVGIVGDSLAMIRGADGTVALVAVGEQVGGAQLVAIRPTQVDLRSGEGSFTLDKVSDTATGTAEPAVPDVQNALPANHDPKNFSHGY